MERKVETSLTLTISLDKDFFEFLRQKGCFEGYVRNVKNRKNNVRTFFENLEKDGSGSPSWVIAGAFCWLDSPEGHDFWSDIRDEWLRLCCPEWENVKSCKVHWLDLGAWEEVFEGKLLAGKRYSIGDNSWNRPALEQWQSDTWNFFDRNCESGWRDLVNLCPEGFLILSDYPVEKILVDGPGHKTYPEEFIKVLLPDGRPWWVLYDERCVL